MPKDYRNDGRRARIYRKNRRLPKKLHPAPFVKSIKVCQFSAIRGSSSANTTSEGRTHGDEEVGTLFINGIVRGGSLRDRARPGTAAAARGAGASRTRGGTRRRTRRWRRRPGAFHPCRHR